MPGLGPAARSSGKFESTRLEVTEPVRVVTVTVRVTVFVTVQLADNRRLSRWPRAPPSDGHAGRGAGLPVTQNESSVDRLAHDS